jgi:hypothetical protein
MQWRKIIFLAVIIIFSAISLSLKAYEFYLFFSKDPLFLSDNNSLNRRLYGDDYQLIEEGLKLPENSRILVTQRRWAANYYLYPRKLYYFNVSNATEETLKDFILQHNIQWIALFQDGRLNLQKVGADR